MPPVATATLIAIGTIITVAPTLDITCENSSVRTASASCRIHGAAWLAQQVLGVLHGAPQLLLQICISVLTLLFSQVMSNVGATVMMVPIAISVALATGGSPAAYAMLVAISSSNTFLISSGHPALMMVAGPGGYTSRDFLRVGLPFTALMLATTLLLVNLVFH